MSENGLDPLAAVLAGTFGGTERVHPTTWSAGGDVEGRAEGRLEAGGTVLVQRHSQVRDGVVSFAGLNAFTLDPVTGETLLYAFDHLGFPPDPPARGGWSGGQLVLLRTTPRGQSRTVYAPTPEGYRWSKVFRSAAELPWALVVEGSLRRTAEA